MTDRSDLPADTPPAPAAPEETAARALPPGIWVPGLITVVILVLAVFAWT